MLSIRLFRTGKKNQPFFKIVVTDKRRPPKGGRFVEEVGFVNPLTKEKSLKAERIKYWISKGAQPSDTINNLLIKEKIIEGKKVALHNKKKMKKGEEAVKPTEKSLADKVEEVKPVEPVKPEEVKNEEVKPEEVKPEEVKNEEVKPEEVKPEEDTKESKDETK
ncbi:MAG: 30S ribosomal protein S16 [Candidatus Nealsonbacteria bacterium]